MRQRLSINGRDREVEADGDTPLLYILRDDLGLHGPKFGCGLGQCGACTVIADGTAIRSCQLPLEQAAGRKIVTLDGIGSAAHPHPVQRAFLAEQAAQCGYCTNGMIMGAKALLDANKQPTDADIRNALSGNLCRCGTHSRILRAVHRAAKEMRS